MDKPVRLQYKPAPLRAQARASTLVPSLTNPYLSFTFDPNTGRWGLYPRQSETPYLEAVRFGAVYGAPAIARGQRAVRWEGAIQGCRAEPLTQVDSPHGRLTVLKMNLTPTLALPHLLLQDGRG